MILANRLRLLRDKHQEFERLIRQESRRVVPDSLRLGQLKRQKLAVKEEIDQLERQDAAAGA